MVFDCMEIVRDDVLLAHSRCDEDAVDGNDAHRHDDENEDDSNVGCEHHRHRYDRNASAIESDDDAPTLLSLFIASVSRCCSLLHDRQMPILPQSSSSSSATAPAPAAAAAAPAAASKPCYEVHDSVASSATRLLRRMVSMFPVRR